MEPAATALGLVRQAYGNAKDLARIPLAPLQGPIAAELVRLLMAGLVVALVALGAMLLGLGAGACGRWQRPGE